MSEIVAPVRNDDGSNNDEVKQAIAAVVLGESVVLERLRVDIRYRLPDGTVRFLRFGDDDVFNPKMRLVTQQFLLADGEVPLGYVLDDDEDDS